MSHYFTDDPDVRSDRQTHAVEFDGELYMFDTDRGVFSKTGADRGSLLLVKTVTEHTQLSGRVLDLGCGWGLVGILVKSVCPDADVIGTDVNPRALQLAKDNAARNGVSVDYRLSDAFDSVPELLDTVLVNPPVRAGKAVVYRMFREAYAHLKKGGALYTVIRRKQGAESAVRELENIFGNCEILERDKGYWVLKNSRLTD